MPLMAARFLAIDWALTHSDVREDRFYDAPSFASCEALLVDPRSVSERFIQDVPPERDGVRRTYADSDRGYGRTLSRTMARRRAESSDLLTRVGGIAVVRLHPRGEGLEVVSPGLPAERIDRMSWLPSVSLVDRQHQLVFPANTRFLARKGEDLVLAGSGHPLEDYLAEFAGRVVYHAIFQDSLGTPLDRFATVIARNRAGDTVAVVLPFDEGRLALLPAVEGVPPAREAAALVEALKGMVLRPAFSPEPDWLPSYTLPGEDALRDELGSLRERREKLDQKIDEVSDRLESVAHPKRLLYTKGRFSLLPAAEQAFAALGFEAEISDGDLLLSSPEGDATVVVSACEETEVGLAPYRHLLDRVDRSRTEGEGPDKGILVVSGSRELDPRRRATQFAPEVLRGCQSQRFCLLTTYALFKLVEAAAQGADGASLASVRRRILDTEGEFRGVPA